MSNVPDAHKLANDVATGDKYGTEALQIRTLVEHNNTTAAADRLHLDSSLAPHELHKFMSALQKECKDLPNFSIVDDRNGIKVSAQVDAGNGNKEVKSLFERGATELSKTHDKIPMTGEMLGLSADETKNVLAIQAQEKAENGGKSHKFGDIVVSLGYRPPDEVNAALRQQDHLNANQLAGDMAHLMPLGPQQGYFQKLKQDHPELSDQEASSLAHYMLSINGGHVHHLHAGEQLAVLNDQERAQLAQKLYEKRVHETGEVRAHVGQNLAEIPIN